MCSMGELLIECVALELNIKTCLWFMGKMSEQWKESRKESSLFLLTLKYLSKDSAERFLLFCVTVFC